ncbi:MAG: hypothetical protein EA356_05990 [Geminicoccaceae bacterium]|nr:MAG: hypothetical protein EA356_05990 [Geminicoccaceae bacterium]
MLPTSFAPVLGPCMMPSVEPPYRRAGVQLALLGAVRLRGPNGACADIPVRKTRAVLALLALSPDGSLPRSRLGDLLWGEREESQARGSLRQALFELRRATAAVGGADVLASDRDRVTLRVDRLAIDLVHEPADVARMELDALAPVLAAWQRQPMEDLDGIGGAFDDWLRDERSGRRERFVRSLVQRLSLEQPSETVLRLTRSLVQIDPTHEPAHRLLMRAYSAQQDRGGALAHYERVEQLFQREFGVAPHAETLDTALALQEAPARPFAVEEAAKPGSRPRLAIARIDQAEGDAPGGALGAMLRDDLAFMLERAQEFDLVDAPADDASGGLADLVLHLNSRPIGAMLRVHLALTTPGSGRRLWSDRFDVPVDGDAPIGDGVTARMAAAVLSGALAQLVSLSTRSRQARSDSFEKFLRGRRLADVMPTRDRLRAAMDLFEQAVTADPHNVIATIYLVRLLNTQLLETEVGADPEPWRQRARNLATHAYELDPNSAVCNIVMGWCHLRARRFGEARWHIEHALELNPYHPERLTDAATAFMYLGEHDRAHACWSKAQAMDSDTVDQRWADAIEIHVMRHDYRAALQAADRLRTLTLRRLACICVAASQAGQVERAEAAHQELVRMGRELWVGSEPFSEAGLIDWLFAHFPFANPEDEALFRRGLRDSGLPS